MKLIHYPERSSWEGLVRRPVLDTQSLTGQVRQILAAVRSEGDEAVRRFTLAFDKVSIAGLEVTPSEIAGAGDRLDVSLRVAMQLACRNIEAFHRTQSSPVVPMETMPGVRCWRRNVPIDRVGLYIPGGTAPLFSTILMLGIPARLAGCRQVVLCSPPGPAGKLDPAILYAASLVGITRVFRVGGVQAIAAMAFGTQSIPRVDKIFGPGNQYVTCAKQLIQQEGVAIDLPAGPSEVAIYADETADPAFVAADLLSQAEHGADSQVLLVVNRAELFEQVSRELDSQLARLPRRDLAARALANSQAVLVHDEAEAMDLLNAYAPEHLILASDRSADLAERVQNAGSVFLGHYSPESAGDYASGTNHTLPTNGYARAYSGVSLDSFVKKITFQELTREGLAGIGSAVQAMAAAEGLEAHARAVAVRFEGKTN
ncbi:MAG TPA: histidinol dehydrogenase [Chitinophagaceae bacterium]|nr:histidinol dehydrogenase [Chitinophagaceae bacterium]